MPTDFRDIIAQLPPERQKRIQERYEELREEYLTLQDLRKARKLTQAQLAETLGQRQVSIAKLEKRSDLLLSTLRRYVEAMGGELKLTVRFPDRGPVVLDRIGEADPDKEPGLTP